MQIFADCHFHALTLREPVFSAVLSPICDSGLTAIPDNVTDNYIISRDVNIFRMLANGITAFERPIADIFLMMEADLQGAFTSERKESYAPLIPYISDGKFRFRGMEADKLFMFPLLMDFTPDPGKAGSSYYKPLPGDRMESYIDATLEGMREYYRQSPDGLFEFYPFAGINPRVHSLYHLEEFLGKHINTGGRMHAGHQIEEKPFYGIKIYPPLGFEPWPEDGETREKHQLLYSFCEKNHVPIITHADDQGFRSVPAETAWAYTDPAAWLPVLKEYPELKIDFAHFGKQYAIRNKGSLSSLAMKLMRLPDSPWFLTIISLMEDFPNVYADLSFSGAVPAFYRELHEFMEVLHEGEREKIAKRILFGSDFAVNLLKVESYTEYLSIFEASPFSDEDIASFASANPLEFLGFGQAEKKPGMIPGREA